MAVAASWEIRATCSARTVFVGPVKCRMVGEATEKKKKTEGKERKRVKNTNRENKRMEMENEKGVRKGTNVEGVG